MKLNQHNVLAVGISRYFLKVNGARLTRDMSNYSIETSSLLYVFANSKKGLDDISIQIEWGTTNLLVGPNGAGKSTLLKILAGKTLIKQGSVKLGGYDPFLPPTQASTQSNSDINNFVLYLGTEWANNQITKRDIPVKELIGSITRPGYEERRDALIKIMDVDESWSMAFVSDGERRRVQLVMGLLKPWKILLLDEVTVDLDVVVRHKLLDFLKQECRERGCCVVYATHIFDGLGKKWCDRVLHLSAGRVVDDYTSDKLSFGFYPEGIEIRDGKVGVGYSESLHPLVLQWLQRDLGISK